MIDKRSKIERRNFTQRTRRARSSRRKNVGFFFLFLFTLHFSLFTFHLHAQEATEEIPPAEEQVLVEAIPEELPPAQEQQRAELEIKASTLPELALWCRTLGLSESGTKEELAKRLREHLKLPLPKETADTSRKVITIESAQTSEYFKIEVIDEDYARLKGEVRISLIDKESTHRIRANEILFNRTRNILTASGNVEYIKDKEGTTEIFRGENITVDIDDWSSIFLDGDSVRKIGNEDTAYRFTGTVITRSDEDVTVLRNAEVSNANNEEALWSISASKIWLLPGSDFALLNAVLKVGEIPVLYIPFFFYPADDLIFHPVIGYRSREGGYVQTTTYILGRPKVDSADISSISRILGNSNDMEKERQGLFLRSTGKKVTDPNEITLRALVDYYTNLGAYFGVDLIVPKRGIINNLDLSMGIGLTRTVVQTGGSYNPFAPNYDGSSDWNISNLFSNMVPFRYRFKAENSISGTYGNLSLSFPYYSDPFIDKDFMKRSEYMDWFNMIQQGAAMEDEMDERTDIQAYQWQLNGSLRPSLPALAPYVSSVNISSFSMTMSFKKIDDPSYKNNKDSPSRTFFAPDKYTLYSISGSIAGTPLTIGGQSQSASINKQIEPEDPFKGIGTPRSPWTKTEEEQTQKKSSGELLTPPVLAQTFDLVRKGNNKFYIEYQISPTSSTELQFRSGYNNWRDSEEVDWSEIQSILASFGGNSYIKFNLDHTSGLFSNSITFTGNAAWREYSYLNRDAEAFRRPYTIGSEEYYAETDETKIEAAKKQQYGQTNYSTSYAYLGTLWPFYDNPIFGQSNLQYTFGGTLVRSKRYTDGNGPQLAPQWGGWVKEKLGEDIFGLTSHKFTTNFAANIMDKMQNISLSADIPPLDPLIATNMTFRAWISETNARVDFKKPEYINNARNDDWKIDPFHFTETLRFGTFGVYSYYMVFEPDKSNEITSITTSLSLWSFKASFTAVKSTGWEFKKKDDGNQWNNSGEWIEIQGDQTLHPKELTFTYIRSFAKTDIIKDRLNFSLNVNTRLSYDLQRHTDSIFQFTFGFTVGINKFLDFSLSATSENKVIWRYFKNFPGMEDLTSMYIEGPQNNPIIDLIDSFNFGNDAKRQRSGFKMKSFNLTADHYLGDWIATLGITMSPYLKQDSEPQNRRYEINAEVSFVVKWTAISEIKTDMKYEKRTETWTKR